MIDNPLVRHCRTSGFYTCKRSHLFDKCRTSGFNSGLKCHLIDVKKIIEYLESHLFDNVSHLFDVPFDRNNQKLSNKWDVDQVDTHLFDVPLDRKSWKIVDQVRRRSSGYTLVRRPTCSTTHLFDIISENCRSSATSIKWLHTCSTSHLFRGGGAVSKLGGAEALPHL